MDANASKFERRDMSLKTFHVLLLSLIAAPALATPSAGGLTPQKTNSLYEPLNLERIVDGDTFYASGKKIRMWGIDAPETNEAMFEISKKALELYMDGADLRCKHIEMDRYQRFVMHCFINDTDLGGLMVQTGFAKDFTKYSGGFYRSEEQFAREGRLGVWE